MPIQSKYWMRPRQSVEPIRPQPMMEFCGKESPSRPEMNEPIAYVNMNDMSICERMILSTPARTRSIFTLV